MEFRVADLVNLQPANPEPATAFDAVLCLGNSLPHLLTQADLVAALRSMAGVLRPGGLLILQNLNYDLRWQKQPRWFAAQGGELDGQQVLVWRFADYDMPAGRIDFHIALFRRGERDWKVDVHTTPQRPLFQVDLLAALAEAGFGEAQTYARMTTPSEPFDAKKSGGSGDRGGKEQRIANPDCLLQSRILLSASCCSLFAVCRRLPPFTLLHVMVDVIAQPCCEGDGDGDVELAA